MQRSLGTAKQICFSGEGRRAIWTGSATQCGESQQGALSAGSCWPRTVPSCRWALANPELWENQRLQALPMDAAQERMGRRGRRTGLLPSQWLCHRTAAFLSHPEVSPSGGSKGKRNRREIHALPHVVDKGSCYTHSIKLPHFSEGVFWEDPQLLPHIYI